MSDVMPYPSSRFIDLTETQIREYNAVFERVIESVVRNFQPDIVHSHHLWLLTALARRILPEYPIVTSCHGSDLRQFRNCPHLRDTVAAGCRGVDSVLALSNSQRDDIASLYGIDPTRIYVTGAGYNDALFQPVKKPAPNPVRLLYAGKLSRAKGVPWMLRVLNDIDAPEWTLDLVGGGSGPESDECIALADAMGRRVVRHGAVSHAELADRMKASHILILPSFFEGLPLVIIEALACGCRIVATELPGVNELAAGFPESCISRVPPPRLHHADQPFPEDIPDFMKQLDRAIRTQMQYAAESPDMPDETIRSLVSGRSWSSVFEKIQTIYHDTYSSRRTT